MESTKFDQIRERTINWLKNPYNLLLLAIIIFAIGVRLYFFFKTMNQAVWWDEGEYMLRVKHLVLDTPQSGFFVGREVFTPYFWALIYSIFKSEVAIRFTQVIFSSLAVLATYYLGKEVYDKKVGILSALFMSTFWLHLFFTTRLLTYLYAPLFYTLALALFWKARYTDTSKSNLYYFLSFLTIIIGLGVYYSIAFAAIVLFIFLVITEQYKFILDKKLWKPFLLSTPFLLLSFISSYLVQGSIIPRLSQISTSRVKETGAEFMVGLFIYVKMMPRLMLFLYLILMILSFFLLLRLIFYFDFVVKNRENVLEFKKDFYIFLAAFVPFAIFTWFSTQTGGPAGASYDAWILPVFPPLFCFMSRFLVYVGNKFKPIIKNKHLIFSLLVFVILMGAFAHLSFANASITAKADSFYNLKPAGEWIKENTMKGDVIIAGPVPELTYYTEREVISIDDGIKEGGHYIDGKVSVDLLQETINERRPPYLVLTLWEGGKQWLTEIPNSAERLNLSIAQIYFLDEAKTQPDVIIYKITY